MKMNKISGLLLTMLILAGVSPAMAIGPDNEWLGKKPEWAPTVTAATSFMTKYIWRGQNLGDDPVIQPEVAISKWGLTASFWGNYNTRVKKSDDSTISTQEFTEFDNTIDYTFNVGDMSKKFDLGEAGLLAPLSLSTGYIYYIFPNQNQHSKKFDSDEIYLGGVYSCFLNPSFKWYYDFEQGRGSYLQWGISHTFDLGSGITADTAITAAYNVHQWTPKTGWSDMNFSGGVNIPVLRYFVIRPNMAYSLILNRSTYNDAQKNEFYGGVKVGFAY